MGQYGTQKIRGYMWTILIKNVNRNEIDQMLSNSETILDELNTDNFLETARKLILIGF